MGGVRLLILVAVLAAAGAIPRETGPAGRIWSFDWRPRSAARSAREARSFSLERPPVPGAEIRRPEGEFGALRRNGRSYHKGVDFLAPRGTVVVAPRDGFVCYNELNGRLDQGYGYTLLIDHADNFYTLYAHLDGPSPLRPGQWVRAGRPIGRVGHSGNASRLPKRFQNQLHFEIIHAPSGLMDLGGVRITGMLSEQRITTLRRIGEAVYGIYWGGVVNPEEFGSGK